FRSVEFATADQIASAEFFEDRRIGRCVRLEAFLVCYVDAPDPITLGHSKSPFVFGYGSTEIATGFATGRIKIDWDLARRYSLMIAVRHNKTSTNGTVRD